MQVRPSASGAGRLGDFTVACRVDDDVAPRVVLARRDTGRLDVVNDSVVVPERDLGQLMFGQLIHVGHDQRRQHEGHVQDHVPHELVVGDLMRIDENPQQMDGRDRYDGGGDF